ncbi:ABCA10 isoform 11, partial [Pongo abelii]
SDTLSYRLTFNWGYRIPVIKEHSEYTEHCWAIHGEIFCYLAKYWLKGFVAFQAAINAAIIEVTTNHSVMEELTSVIGINMKIPPFISKEEIMNEWFLFTCLVSFSSFIYFASLNIARERGKFKKLMTVMGLRELAF